MIPYSNQLSLVYLKPGELFMGVKPAMVTTVLGSCVSVTMFNNRLQVGSICHALYPVCKHPQCTDACIERHRFLDCSIIQMLEKLTLLGIGEKELEVKIFGGADIIGNRTKALSVGQQNSDFAKRMIENKRLKVAAMDLGGRVGRKIFFCTSTGEVWLKRLGHEKR